MRTILTLCFLAAFVLAAGTVADLSDDLGTRISVLTGTTNPVEKKELGSLVKAKDSVDGWLAAGVNDKKARGLLVKAAKSIVKAASPVAAITTDGQQAVYGDLTQAALDRSQEALDLQADLVLANAPGATLAKLADLIDAGNDLGLDADNLYPLDPAKAAATMQKAAAAFEKATAYAEKALAAL